MINLCIQSGKTGIDLMVWYMLICKVECFSFSCDNVIICQWRSFCTVWLQVVVLELGKRDDSMTYQIIYEHHLDIPLCILSNFALTCGYVPELSFSHNFCTMINLFMSLKYCIKSREMIFPWNDLVNSFLFFLREYSGSSNLLILLFYWITLRVVLVSSCVTHTCYYFSLYPIPSLRKKLVMLRVLVQN